VGDLTFTRLWDAAILPPMSMPIETERMERGDAPIPRRTAIVRPDEAGHGARKFVWPALLVLLGVAAMRVDLPLAHLLRSKGLPGLNKPVQLAEVFGHGVGVAAILLTAWIVAPQVRAKLPRVVGAAYLGGLAADVAKLFLARARPHTIHQWTDLRVTDTFHGWFPFFSNGSSWQSFPSSHTAVAVGLAIGLSWLFPRGEWLFAAFAVLAGAQRVVSGNHFLSDVLWGAALGWLCATACMPGGWLSPLFDRLETWQIARSQRAVR
jgi:membrane-associated phospholipid phosphatase